MTKGFTKRHFAMGAVSLTALLACAAPAMAETITVLLPSFGSDATTRDMLKQFTTETGIEVNLEAMPWDDIRPKIVTATMAGSSPADVTEFDWSWVGQFGAAQWYVPLDTSFDKAVLDDMPTRQVFTYEGKLYGVPYANDFRLQAINTAMFKKAGITGLPTTPAEILADAKTLKDKGVVKYPICVPLSASEGTATAWYFLTRMHGGELFDKDWHPLFTDKGSPGYKALEWLVQALHDGLIDPAMTGLTDIQVTSAVAAGDGAIDLASHPYDLGTYEDASKSKVVGQTVYTLAGVNPAKLRTIGLPEALGIPVKSAHKDAAIKFIAWWSNHQATIYQTVNVLPTRGSVLEELAKTKKLAGGDEVAKLSPFTEAIFAQGTPSWYSEFSSTASATINQLAKGQIGVDAAVEQIAAKAKAAQQ